MPNKNGDSCLTSFLKLLSIGQYRTILYHKGKDTYSSACGGLVTILCAFILLSFAGSKIFDVINLKEYSLEKQFIELTRYD